MRGSKGFDLYKRCALCHKPFLASLKKATAEPLTMQVRIQCEAVDFPGSVEMLAQACKTHQTRLNKNREAR